MAQSNTVELNIPEPDLQAINEAVNTLNNLLKPHLVNLTPEESRELLRMGDKTVAFVNKSIEYARDNPDLVPNFLDIEAFDKDLKTIELLGGLARKLRPLFESLDDTLAISGSEAYQAALIFYRSTRMASASGITSAGSIYDDLATRFPNGRSTPSSNGATQ